MAASVQYLTNDAGERTSVVIPYAAWAKLRQERQLLRQKLQVMQGIASGMAEVKAAKAAGQPLPSLRAFLEADDAATITTKKLTALIGQL